MNLGNNFPAHADGESRPAHGLVDSIVEDREQQEQEEQQQAGYGDEAEQERQRDEAITQLARRATSRSMFSTIEGDPFGRGGDELDPASEKFSARAWTKAVLRGANARPETHRVTGFAFKNVQVHGFGTDSDYQKTVGNAVLQLKSLVSKLAGAKQTRIDILHGVDALVHPGEMLVVLGPPGSGCSTFLKSIAGEEHGIYVNKADNYQNYRGIPSQQMIQQFRGEATYAAEVDVHFPSLPVGETLYFAARCRTPRILPSGVSPKEYAEMVRDTAMATYGMSHTMNTKVGNEFVRGVSGGERKRVSIIEAALSGAPLQCWDNSTRGLDAANAVEFCKTLKMGADIQGITSCVSLYQAPEDAYQCFDKVTVLYEGRQIYFGPAREAQAFFVDMGFDCPARQTTPDFLTSLTSPKERKARPGFEKKVPRTPDEFVARWKSSQTYAQLMADIDEYDKKHPIGGQDLEAFKASRKATQAKSQSVKSPYTLSYPQQVQICLWRGFRRLAADPSLTLTQLIGNIIFALILSSIFYNLQGNTDSFYQRGALLFFAILFNAFASALEILTLYAQRPIVEKHTRYALYRPSAEAFASMLCDIPYKIVNTTLFNLTLYFMAHLRREPGPFFYFIFISFLLVLTVSSLFRTIAAASRSLVEALAPAAVIIVALVLYAGFALPPPSMLGWSSWIRYINPVFFGLECLFINEFQNRQFDCSNVVPPYPDAAPESQVCTTVGSVAGQAYVEGTAYIQQSYNYQPDHQWRNVWIIIIFWLGLTAAYIFFSEFITERKSKGEVLIFKRSYFKKMKKEAKQQNDIESVSTNEKVTEQGSSDDDSDVNILRQTSIFSWRDVRFTVKIKSEERVILDGVDGWVKPGTLTALMGASGAGKTSLLDSLANRTTTGVVTGEMLVDGRQRDASFQRKTGYVQQGDLHLPTSTVREALSFSALLRQPARYSKEERLAYVDEVIKLLDMSLYSDAVVGVPGEGLNVEQYVEAMSIMSMLRFEDPLRCVPYKVGVELAARPELLLFLDEPTSGLDSQTSWSIMDLLEKLTQKGQAILCTVHQPSAMLFQRFDRLLLLAKGGKTVYFGDIGKDSNTMINYFEKNGGAPCPPQRNPAEMMLEWIGAAPGSHTDINWPEVWHSSKEKQEVHAELERLKERSNDPETKPSEDPSYHSEFAADFRTQVQAVLLRAFQQHWRTPSYIFSKFFLVSAVGLFIGFSFFQLENTLQALQSQLFAVFLLFLNFGQLTQMIQPQFVIQRSLYEARERPSKTFSWQTFMLSNILVELPWNTLVAVVLFFCWYYPIGYYDNAAGEVAERGALMFLFVLSFIWMASTFAHMMIAALPTAEVAGNMGNLLFTFMLLFCGVLATKDQLPGFWIFMYYLNPFRFLVEGMLSTAIAHATVQCAAREFVTFSPPNGQTCEQYMEPYLNAAGGYLRDPSSTTECALCPIYSTDVFLQSFGFTYQHAWRDFGIVWVFIVFNIFAAVFFYWLGRVPKNPMKQKKKKE